MRNRILAAAALLLAATALTACGGGGGGGGGGPSGGVVTPTPPAPVTPPALPTPPGPPAGSSASAVVWIGPSTAMTVGGNPVTRRIDNVASNISVVYDSQGTASTADDRYTVRYGPDGYERSFTGFAPTSDGLGTYRFSSQTVGGRGESLYLMDIANAFANSLDYVQMLGFERETDATHAQLAYLTVGVQTPRASMPTTGTARFEGETRGVLSPFPSEAYITVSDIQMTANFASGALNGSTSNFRNHSVVAANRSIANDLNFTFTGSITAGTANFTGTASTVNYGGPGMTGTVQGTFFGPNADEVGLAYDMSMSTSSAQMQGVAVMGRKP